MKNILVLVVLFATTVSLNAQSLNGKTFTIQSANPSANGRVIDADGYTLGKNGTKIQLWDKNGVSHQNWKFIFANKGENTYYIMSESPKAGIHKYLDASAIDLGKNGGVVFLWQDNGHANGRAEANQLWTVTKNVDGTYRIASAHPKAKGASLDADGYTQGKNGGKVQLWKWLNNKNQAWKLIPISEKKLIGQEEVKGYSSWTENTLFAGETLKAGQKLIVSDNGKYILKLQASDGNLCVYKYANNKQGSFVWGSMKYGFKNARLDMQTDGNLVVYDAENKPRWSSKTHYVHDEKYRDPNNKPVKLVLENNGILKLYTKSGEVVWSSKNH
jgi:hypothetical protein